MASLNLNAVKLQGLLYGDILTSSRSILMVFRLQVVTMPKLEARGGYHHGDLRHAMIEAAEEVLAEKGVAGFTLRECARRAGVSPAAPAHHFGNLAGLLTAIATLGFDDLSDAMEAAASGADARGEDRLAAVARAYVDTALARPGRFRVVFGRRELDHAAPDFKRAASRAFGLLVRETRARLAVQDNEPLSLPPATFAEDPDLGAILFVWSVTHGFSTLLIDGQLDFLTGEAGRPAMVELYATKLVHLLLGSLGGGSGLANRSGDH
jgi:AcrR family transcriptional regulator